MPRNFKDKWLFVESGEQILGEQADGASASRFAGASGGVEVPRETASDCMGLVGKGLLWKKPHDGEKLFCLSYQNRFINILLLLLAR